MATEAERLQARAKLHLAKRQQAIASVHANVEPRLLDWRGLSRFCPTYLRIKPQEEVENLIPLTPNWLQRRVVYEEIKARRAGKRPWFLILKYRKGGVTTIQQAMSYWQCWRKRHQQCITLSSEPLSTRIIFTMVRRFYDEMPESVRHEKSEAYVGHIEFPKWGSLYLADTAGQRRIGHGATLSRCHLSESAHYQHLGLIHTGLYDAMGPESAYVLETTANGREGPGEVFYDMYLKAKAGDSTFIPLFFAWYDDPQNTIAFEPDELAERLKTDPKSADIQKRYKLTDGQMAWYIAKKRALVAGGQSELLIDQEHPCDDDSCFLLSVESYFDLDLLAKCESLCRDPVKVEENGRLFIWEVPDPDRPASYIMSSDVGEGVKRDKSTVIGFNMRTGRQAFTWMFNGIAPDEFGKTVVPTLGKRWANPSSNQPAFVVMERNNHGHAALGLLLNEPTLYPRDRVYHDIDDTVVDENGDYVESLKPGWNNTVRSHKDLSVAVARMVRDCDPRILDKRVIQDIRAVPQGPNGPVFRGRDLAVAAGLSVIGWPHAAEESDWAFIGGKAVKLGDGSQAAA